jgi:hypothetical protein
VDVDSKEDDSGELQNARELFELHGALVFTICAQRVSGYLSATVAGHLEQGVYFPVLMRSPLNEP